MERLFVYGTLGPGRPNEHVMQKIGGSWQPASVRGRLVHAGWGFERSGFPALVLDEDGEEITGHVFVSPNLAAHWPALDAFEGEDYVRELTRAILADGTEVEQEISDDPTDRSLRTIRVPATSGDQVVLRIDEVAKGKRNTTMISEVRFAAPAR